MRRNYWLMIGMVVALGALWGLAASAAAQTTPLEKFPLAWGANNFGQLGDGTTINRLTPVRVLGPGGTGFLTGVAAVTGGILHSLALKRDGTVFVWGTDPASLFVTAPVQVLGPGGIGFLTGMKALAAGKIDHGGFSLALKTDGTVFGWGTNTSWQLGIGIVSNEVWPVQVKDLNDATGFLTGVADIAAGSEHSLALKDDGTVFGWGTGLDLFLGSATFKLTDPNDPSGFLTGVAAVAAGSEHSLALKADGRVWARGRTNVRGQLGNGTTTAGAGLVRDFRDPTGFLTKIVAIAAGDNHSLALKADGTVFAWGDNRSGQLGDATTTQRLTAVPVVAPKGKGLLTGVVAIAAGGRHSLARKADGTVVAWGDNFFGQLGDATTLNRTRPVPVLDLDGRHTLSDIVGIAAGENHSLAVAFKPLTP